MLVSFTISTHSQTTVTFDDLPESGAINGYLGYYGLNWLEVSIFDPYAHTTDNMLSGYNYGMVSAPNVAYNPFGNNSEINSGTNYFNFYSVYLTGAWNSNLNIEVQGYTGTNQLEYGYGPEGGTVLVYDTNVIASATFPTLFTFNYTNINRLVFISSGGQSAGFGDGGEGTEFVMDNFTFELVPEPSPLLLTAGAALLLWPILKRRRTYSSREAPTP